MFDTDRKSATLTVIRGKAKQFFNYENFIERCQSDAK